MRPDTYEMTFTGRADKTLCAQFDDCDVTISPDTTTEEVTGAAHGDQQRTVALELSHRISLAGEAIGRPGGELDIVGTEVAVRKIIDRHRRRVIADLTTLSFCAARGLAALVRMAGYAEQMGCTFRLASPSLSLVKIMRITGPDRRFLAFQVLEQAVRLRLP